LLARGGVYARLVAAQLGGITAALDAPGDHSQGTNGAPRSDARSTPAVGALE
jgi:hypothetical protein